MKRYPTDIFLMRTEFYYNLSQNVEFPFNI